MQYKIRESVHHEFSKNTLIKILDLKRFAIPIFLMFVFYSNAQNTRIIDSLKTVVAKTSDPEKKISVLYTLFQNLRYRDSTECDNIASEGLNLSKQVGDKDYQSLFSLGKHKIYSLFQDSAEAKKYLDIGFELAKNGNDKSQAMANLRKGEYSEQNIKNDSTVYFYLKAENLFKKTDDCFMHVRTFQALASLYSDQGLIDKQLFFARKGLASANACENPDAKMMAMFTMAVAASDQFRADTIKNVAFGDSIAYFYKEVIREANENDNVTFYSIVPDAYFNMGANFYEQDQVKNADSTLYYFDKSIEADAISGPSVNDQRTAMMHIINARIYVQKKNYEDAHKTLNMLPLIYPELNEDAYLAIRYYATKTMYAEAMGDYKDAVEQLKLQMEFNDKLYNQEKLGTVKRIETEFTNYRQQQELKNALDEISNKRKLNYLYLALAGIGLIGLVFMYRSYYFRQRDFMKQKTLLEKEKEEAELQTRLKEEEALNAIMEKELMEQDRQMALQEKMLTEEQRESLQNELMTNRLQLETKNNFLREIKEKLPSIESPRISDLKNIGRSIDKNLESDTEFDLLKKSFESANPRFFMILNDKAGGSLTQLDLKYCGYIKIGMTTKEIANLMHIEPKSMRMARYRIRQKLGLEKEQELDSFIVGI